ncbi:MAG: DUF2809 domain-containing protein [Chitinophagaceae bacterium]|nr:MAG: DUF2809 domain-containing protein [Chitinophagaceae bacterium]
MRFNKIYFFLFVLLFITEVLIALYLHDRFIRPYVGDVLVVIMLYCLVRSFFRWPVVRTAIAVLLFSYIVEACQYFRVIYALGLAQSKLARVVMGIGFDWTDILAYTLGFAAVLAAEYFLQPEAARQQPFSRYI